MVRLVYKDEELISFAANAGQSAALWYGCRAAKGDIIATLDGDGQNDPHDMKRLSASIDEAVAARSFQLLVVYDKKLNGLAFYRDEILDHINPGMSDQLS